MVSELPVFVVFIVMELVGLLEILRIFDHIKKKYPRALIYNLLFEKNNEFL
jgi:hypothetical protein